MDRILLFQLSDLHFGSTFGGTCVASLGSQAGLNGHALTICQNLPVSIDRIQNEDFGVEDNDAVEYLIGGDLTRTGSDHDYQLIYSYLFSKLTWFTNRHGNFESMGLGLEATRVHCIPGNHDHWKGQTSVGLWNRPPAYNSGVFPQLLEPTPWRHTIWSRNKKFALELFGVDSNEGLPHNGTNLRARGVLSNGELYGVISSGRVVKKGLQQLLRDAQNDAISDKVKRVGGVACHHAFGSKNGISGAWPLDSKSIQDLLTLVRQFRNPYLVAAIFTGHEHYPIRYDWPISTNQDRISEVRCASTLQMDPQPFPHSQGFWVHEIKLAESGDADWIAWEYYWNGTQFLKKNPYGERIL